MSSYTCTSNITSTSPHYNHPPTNKRNPRPIWRLGKWEPPASWAFYTKLSLNIWNAQLTPSGPGLLKILSIFFSRPKRWSQMRSQIQGHFSKEKRCSSTEQSDSTRLSQIVTASVHARTVLPDLFDRLASQTFTPWTISSQPLSQEQFHIFVIILLN